jgi:hypothetical protein
MNTLPQSDQQEIHLQERAGETLADDSLPAAQVIEEQKNDADSTRNNAPCFIP